MEEDVSWLITSVQWNRTGKDWTGLEWNGLKWTEMDWNRLDWTEQDWAKLHYNIGLTIVSYLELGTNTIIIMLLS